MNLYHRPFSVILSFCALAIIGIGLIPQLSVKYLPSVQGNKLNIQFAWPGASPALIEQKITSTLEGGLALIPGIDKIYSVSESGRGNITLDVSPSVEVDVLRFEVASKLRQLYVNFPGGAGFPILTVYNPDDDQRDQPILTYSMSGNQPASEIYRFTQEIFAPKLSGIEGLDHISILGGNEREWRLYYDELLMQQYGLKAADLINTLQQYAAQTSVGMSKDNDQYLSVLWNQNRDSVNWSSISLTTATGKQIYLTDIAEVAQTERPTIRYYRINGANSVRILFYPTPNANNITLAEEIKRSIDQEKHTLPNQYRLNLENDGTRFLQLELTKIQWRSIFSLGLLLLFVGIVYWNIRLLLLVLISLGINLGMAVFFYYWFQIEINLYGLAGITVSFGLLIDNIIVMAHHVKGQGDLRVFPALLAATLTTISALLIILFLPDRWRHDLNSFAWVMGINLLLSLLIARWLVPAIVVQWKLQQNKSSHPVFSRKARRGIRFLKGYQRLFAFLRRFRGAVIGGMILLFGLPVFLLPSKIDGWDWYNKSFGSDWYIEEVKPTVNRVFGGTLRLFMWYVYEGSAYRTPEETVLYVQGKMPQGATVHQLDALYRQIEVFLANYPKEIRQFTTSVSSGQYGSCKIVFNPGYDLAFPFFLKNRLVAQSINLGGATWNVYGVGRGFSNNNSAQPPSYRIAMYGYHKADLEGYADQFAEILMQHPRVPEVNTAGHINWWEKDRYEYQMALDQRQLADYRLSSREVFQVLRPFDRSVRSDLILPNGQSVRMISEQGQHKDLWQLKNETLLLDSQQVVINQLANIEKRKVPPAIHKENQQYIQMVEFEYMGSPRFGNQHLKASMEAMEKQLPLGYSLDRRRTFFFSKEEENQLNRLLFLVIGLIFFICSIHFESFRQAVYIILLIPMSFIGIFLTFYGFDFSFDQGGYTSFLLVSGLTVNSLILIINDFNYYYKKYPRRNAFDLYLKAFHRKITPILLTVCSTALGLIPFLMSGAAEPFWFPLAVGTIGGLCFSLVVLVLVVPLFFVGRDK